MTSRWALLSALFVGASALARPATVRAEEGLWTFDRFPLARMKADHGLLLDQKWLDHLRLSSARLGRTCSAGFVSGDGLVVTNQHCIVGCLSQLSRPGTDLVTDGFVASARGDEKRCPGMELQVLESPSDITARVHRATAGLDERTFSAREKTERTRIEEECAASSSDVRCEVVRLHRGAVYHLYRYRRYGDVRLVFAPEQAIAFFGGEMDNFDFPRHALDVAFLRVYSPGGPLHPPDHLRWSSRPARAGDVTFVSGYPGETNRQLTVSELGYARDVSLPDEIARLEQLRRALGRLGRRGARQRQVAERPMADAEGALLAARSRLATLRDPRLFGRLAGEESKLRLAVASRPEWQQAWGHAWDILEGATRAARDMGRRHSVLEGHQGFASALFDHARVLVRAAAERARPNEERLPEYREGALRELEQRLGAESPVDEDLESVRLGVSLAVLARVLGPASDVRKQILRGRTPAQAAAWLVRNTRLAEPAARLALWRGGLSAVRASTDPFIRVALAVDAEARALRERYEREVGGPLKRGGALVGQARLATSGAPQYPDATASLRLSDGLVRGWREGGRDIAPLTTFDGLFARASGRAPFALPARWIEARAQLDGTTPLDFTSDHDIVEGSSGSPVVDGRGGVVGVVFDGNRHMPGGRFAYDGAHNRAISVHGAAVIQALAHVYHADALVRELAPQYTAAANALTPEDSP